MQTTMRTASRLVAAQAGTQSERAAACAMLDSRPGRNEREICDQVRQMMQRVMDESFDDRFAFTSGQRIVNRQSHKGRRRMNGRRSQSDSRIELAPGVWIARDDLHFTFARASGPGGQAVNKLSTKAQLRIAIDAIQGLDHAAAARLRKLAGRRLTASDELLIQAETYRSQLDNKELALDRLREFVAAALIKPKIRRKKKPTRSMIEKRLSGKRMQSQKKQERREKRGRGSETG